jgi:dynein intermediate chain 1
VHKDRAYRTLPNMDHTIFHYEYDGYLVYKGDDAQSVAETKEQSTTEQVNTVSTSTATGDDEAGTNVVADVKTPASRNQFNYSERAAQTLPTQHRDRQTNTDPPPHKSFNASVTQWEIHDAYVEDLASKDRFKEKNKVSFAVISIILDIRRIVKMISRSHLEAQVISQR